MALRKSQDKSGPLLALTAGGHSWAGFKAAALPLVIWRDFCLLGPAGTSPSSHSPGAAAGWVRREEWKPSQAGEEGRVSRAAGVPDAIRTAGASHSRYCKYPSSSWPGLLNNTKRVTD